ncbi:amidohydrolase family protein [Frankia sp. Cr1]|uniref:amidohydrolase family protein n=1 Tax=Frankia sp. Cr1 TaxID=3073931 RepID=UPI002AD3D581|nr:amidohydrolase family protein [Frankia sp. Cr1]
MIENFLVVEGVAHQYNFRPDNLVQPDIGPFLGGMLYGVHSRAGGPDYTLDRATYMRGAGAETIGRAILAESPSDVIVYHETPLYGQFKDGGSDLAVGVQMREMWPNRTLLYGAVSPLRPGAVERVDELVDDYGVQALKMYPSDLVDGRIRGLDLDDPEVCFPVLQRARERGLKIVGIHKALPVGPGPSSALGVGDVEGAALAFPDMIFEIVHGGMAFVEETALALMSLPNVVVNLESTTVLLSFAPRRFAEAIGAFLHAEDRIIWATGCNAAHPRPLLERFWDFEMPRDLVEEYGLPELTREIKGKILGGNFLRMHGIDEAALRSRLKGDEFDTTELAPAWGGNLAKPGAQLVEAS